MSNLQNSTRAENVVGALAVSILPIINVFEWISLVCTASLFVQFLNNWEKFNDLIPINLSATEAQCSVLSMRRTYKILFLPQSVFMAVSHTTRYGWNYVTCSIGALSMIITKSILFQAIALLEDAKILFMFFASTTGYFKVK
jgi:hypothetical protein